MITIQELDNRRTQMGLYMQKLFPPKDGCHCIVIISGVTEDIGYAATYQSTMGVTDAVEHLRRTATAMEKGGEVH